MMLNRIIQIQIHLQYGIPGESEAAPWGDVTDLTTSEDGSEYTQK